MRRLTISATVVLALAGALLSIEVPAVADVGPTRGSGGVGIGVSTAGGAGASASGKASGKTCSWTVTQTNTPEPFKSIWAKVPPPGAPCAAQVIRQVVVAVTW